MAVINLCKIDVWAGAGLMPARQAQQPLSDFPSATCVAGVHNLAVVEPASGASLGNVKRT
jgi:hypothetical protein